jgi:hypothetical protein
MHCQGQKPDAVPGPVYEASAGAFTHVTQVGIAETLVDGL